MKKFLVILICLLTVPVVFNAQDTLTKKEVRKLKRSFLLPDKPWTVEIPLWIPGFAGAFAYGDVDLEGEDGADPEHPIEPPPGGDIGEILSRLFTKEWYLKFFFLTRIAYEKNRFIGQFDALSGSVGESVKFNYNNKEIVQANFRTTNLRLYGGYKIINANTRSKKFRYELFIYLGVRAHFHKISTDLNGAINNLNINPFWFEPILGLQNQFTWKRWFVLIQGDYGGFFIESKYSFQFSSLVYFRSGNITSLKFGWNHLDLNHKGTFLRQDFKIDATFSGPTAGIVFHF